MAIDNRRTITLLIALNAITLLTIMILVGLLVAQRGDMSSQWIADGLDSPLPATGAGPQEETPERRVALPTSGSVEVDGKKQLVPLEQTVGSVDLPVVEPAASSEEIRDLQWTVDDWQAEQTEDERFSWPDDAEDEVGESGTQVDVYLDGGMVRVEEVDEDGNTLISISNTMYDVEQLAAGDQAYLAALDRLKSGSLSHLSMRRPVDAKKAAARESDESHVNRPNYYNKVDLNERQVGEKSHSSLAAEIEAIVGDETDPAMQETNDSGTHRSEEDQQISSVAYVQALKGEYIERANEMRTIRVQAGDSLWKIAEKAYGDGFSYKRLVAANPHLSNPDLLQVGDLIRVPW